MRDIRAFRRIEQCKKVYVKDVAGLDNKFVPVVKQAINGLFESIFMIEDGMVENFKLVADSYGLRVEELGFGERNVCYAEYNETALRVSFDSSERFQFAEFCMMI